MIRKCLVSWQYSRGSARAERFAARNRQKISAQMALTGVACIAVLTAPPTDLRFMYPRLQAKGGPHGRSRWLPFQRLSSNAKLRLHHCLVIPFCIWLFILF